MFIYVIKMSTGYMPAHQCSAVGLMGGNILAVRYVGFYQQASCSPYLGLVFKRTQVMKLMINNRMIYWMPNLQ